MISDFREILAGYLLDWAMSLYPQPYRGELAVVLHPLFTRWKQRLFDELPPRVQEKIRREGICR